ncbi:MAG: hypothetical protein Q8S31_06025 [Alphaproteobacteria bacterium]|nr:hypothetical protein [Alphaproteobacteria bacterium]
MFIFNYFSFKKKSLFLKFNLLIFLGILYVNNIYSSLTDEIIKNSLLSVEEEYLLINYNFLPKKIIDFNYKAENINVDILLEIGDVLLENGKIFFFKFNEFNYTIIPKKYKKKFLNIEATKNYSILYNFDRKIKTAITCLLKTSLEYYKSALAISYLKETQKDIIVQFNVVIAEMRHMLAYVTKDKYQKEFMLLVNEYESNLDEFKINNNLLEIKSAPSLTSYKIKNNK